MAFLASQLAVAAATTLAKKTFEFSVVQSLNGLSDVIRKRFSTSRALQEAQAELEVKVRMLVLPMDILAHLVTRGNTALQEALGVALGVLEEVEGVRLAVVEQHVKQAQDAAASPETSTAQLTGRLRGLVARLDALLPYLNLAVATAALLQQGGAAPPASPSRLMAASWCLRSNPQEGAAVFCLEEASWHEERSLRAAAPRMAEVFPLCSLAVCRCSGVNSSSSSQRPRGALAGYELLLQQDLNDGTHHDPTESAATLRIQVADIVGVEWETQQSLHQVENEYRPALVLHVLESGTAAAEATTPASAPPHAGRPPAPAAVSVGDRRAKPGGAAPRLEDTAGRQRAAAAAPSPHAATPLSAARGGGPVLIRRCAVMCSQKAVSDSEGEEGDDGGCSDDGSSPASSASGGGGGAKSAAAAAPSGSAWRRECRLLGDLEYVLRLCMLEGREQAPHQHISDERIAMAFQPAPSPAAAAAAAAAALAPGVAPGGATEVARRRGGASEVERAQHALGALQLEAECKRLSYGGTPLPSALSPQPAASETAAPPQAESGGDEGGSSSAAPGGRRRSARAAGRGFGSPVQ